jgi:hypothetical protein
VPLTRRKCLQELDDEFIPDAPFTTSRHGGTGCSKSPLCVRRSPFRLSVSIEPK